MSYSFHFKNEKKKLNASQRLAVESIEGPVLTLAGPGTGKTQVLALRIGEILTRQTGISPYNILCLTYTEAGAYNMRLRLQQFIGSDAYKVHVSTYHTFCSQIIRQYPFYFSSKDLKPIDNLAYFELMRDFLLDMDDQNPLKRFSGNLAFDYKHFKLLFSQMEEEGFSEEFVHRAIDSYIEKIKQDKTNKIFFYQRAPNQGNPKTSLEDEEQRKLRLKIAVSQKVLFDEKMKEAGFYTFSQMILWVLDAIKKYPELQLDLQERFQYFLVDEYQDNNNAQNELLFHLCGYWGAQANVFAVGDDDQSIFRFQGANVENIHSFKKKFEHTLTTIVLETNYRSTQSILDSSEAFIGHNTSRLLQNKKLISAKTGQSKVNAQPKIVEYQSELAEEVGTVNQIKQLISHNVCPSEIAVLYTKHQHSQIIEKLLQQEHISYELRSSADILKTKLVQQLIAVLSFLSKESNYPGEQDQLLYKILHFDMVGVSTKLVTDLWIKRKAKRKQTTLLNFLTEVKAKDFTAYTVEEIQKATQFANKLTTLLQDIHNITVQKLVEKALYTLGFLNYASAAEEKIWLLESLYTFFSFIQKETELHPFESLSFFIHRVEAYKKQREPMPAMKIIKQEKSVKLMTLFAAKGLEFEHVLMIKSTPQQWEKKKIPSSPFRLPDTVFSSLKINEEEKKSEEELRRLFYVGMTRAKEGLYISYPAKDNNDKEIGQSRFVAELSDAAQLPIEHSTLIPEPKDVVQLMIPSAKNLPQIQYTNDTFIEERLQQFELSASSLHQYLECPLSFYYNSILRIPSASTPDQGYGKAVHVACKKLYPDFRIPERQSSFLTSNEFLAAFKQELTRHRQAFTIEEYEAYTKRGELFLPKFYGHYIDSFKSEGVTQTEYPIHLVIDGVPVFGILDKLIFNGNKVTIVDYKTGKHSKSLKQTARFSPASSKNPHGGSYWRQGAFYQLLIDCISLKRPEKKWKTEQVRFLYVEPEEKNLAKANLALGDFYIQPFEYSEEHLINLRQLIKTVWEKIQQKEFLVGCGKENDCAWCNFARENQLEKNLS